MAIAFPSSISENVPEAVAKTFYRLKKLPEDFHVWHLLDSSRKTTENAPQFLLIWKERFAYLIQVAATEESLARESIEPSLLNQPAATIGAVESETVTRFAASLDSDIPLRKLVVFPNVKEATLDTIQLQRSEDSGVCYLGLKRLKTDLADYLESIAHTELSAPQVIHLRHHFSPEASIPSSFNPLTASLSPTGQKTRPSREATLTGALLDLDQEWCAKNHLYLSPEADDTLNQTSPTAKHQLVTGVAGSGKSLVLLYRAALSAQHNPGARILVLTHNRPINYLIQSRMDTIAQSGHQITCLTFYQFAKRHLGSFGGDPISPNQVESILAEIVPDQSFEIPFINDEIAFLKDNGIVNKDAYLAMDRTGRRTRLTAKQRSQIWAIRRDYHRILSERNLVDWPGIAMKFRAAALGGELPFPLYDSILIDEGQFFAKTWFDVVRAALRPNGQLFISADPTQGFLKRRQSWLAAGINVRGNSRRLSTPYRNSQSILTFAKSFIEMRQSLSDAPSDPSLSIPTPEQISTIDLIGEPPSIEFAGNGHDCLVRTAEEVLQLAKEQPAQCQILIIHTDTYYTDDIVNMLGSKLPDSHRVHPAGQGKPLPNTFVQVSSLNKVTGMEAPIVFVLGTDALLEKEDSPKLSSNERSELQETHTSMLYVAFTRAGQRLIVFLTNPKHRDPLVRLISPQSE